MPGYEAIEQWLWAVVQNKGDLLLNPKCKDPQKNTTQSRVAIMYFLQGPIFHQSYCMHHDTPNCAVLRGGAAHRNRLRVVPDGGVRGQIFKAVSKKPNSKKLEENMMY